MALPNKPSNSAFGVLRTRMDGDDSRLVGWGSPVSERKGVIFGLVAGLLVTLSSPVVLADEDPEPHFGTAATVRLGALLRGGGGMVAGCRLWDLSFVGGRAEATFGCGSEGQAVVFVAHPSTPGQPFAVTEHFNVIAGTPEPSADLMTAIKERLIAGETGWVWSGERIELPVAGDNPGVVEANAGAPGAPTPSPPPSAQAAPATEAAPTDDQSTGGRWVWLLGAGLLALVAVLRPRR